MCKDCMVHLGELRILYQPYGCYASIIYTSFILPHLQYCSPLLLGVGKVQTNKIEDFNHYITKDSDRAREIIVLPGTLKYM